MHNETDIERHVRGTISIIKEYIETHNEEKAELILERIKMYILSDEVKTFLFSNPHIAEELLEYIYLYIKHRHLKIRDVIEAGLTDLRKPSLFTKMLVRAAMNGNLIIPEPPEVNMLTLATINSAIESIRSRKLKAETGEYKGKLSKTDYIFEIIDKKNLMSSLKQAIKKETNQGIKSIEYVLKTNGRVSGYLERSWRLITLINMLIENEAEIKIMDGKFFVLGKKRVKNE